MGFKSITLNLPTDYSEEALKHAIRRSLEVTEFTYQVAGKSLDARNKRNIHWVLRVGVHSPQLKGGDDQAAAALQIPYGRRNKKVVITGSGPAGFFAAYVLQKAGFDTTIVERGTEVKKRAAEIRTFEKTGLFHPRSNYPFGEGGAGTFSDGKLTSRSKHISQEREFVIQSYIAAGAPPEIAFLAHPHLGTDKLRMIVENLREEFVRLGGTMLFETTMLDIEVRNSGVDAIITDHGLMMADLFVVAPGHSAYDTYRMLMNKGVAFRTKNFAVGTRVEHPQQVINKAQWGTASLPGIKAAEYRLTSAAAGKGKVFTFCMCPGGMVVPAMAFEKNLVVNGMSYFSRNGRFANAACVAAIHPDQLGNKPASPAEALNRVEALEETFYNFSGDYQAPFCSISDFLNEKDPGNLPETSYPLGIRPAQLWRMLPKAVVEPLREGFKDFNRKIRGYDSGIMIGLESKTSSPVQVIRHPGGLCEGFSNLYVVGEGSGYAGGIISSASDGVRAAMGIIERHG